MYLRNVENREIEFDLCLGNPRVINGQVSIRQIRFGDLDIDTLDGGYDHSRFFSKLFGWNISKSDSENIEKKIFRCISHFVSENLFSIRYQKKLKMGVSSDLGFCLVSLRNDFTFHIGYFQTFVFASHPKVLAELSMIQLKYESPQYQKWKKIIELEMPIMMHVRLTDYLLENEFGTPSVGYYERALRYFREKGNQAPVWVFSDDVEEAKRRLSGLGNLEKLFFFKEGELNDIEEWNLMRYFRGYIIANSTYSWWAAFLRECQDVEVCYPRPWFIGKSNPNKLFPTDWNAVFSQ